MSEAKPESRDCPTCESGRRMPRRPVCRECLLHVPFSVVRAWEMARDDRGSQAHVDASAKLIDAVKRGQLSTSRTAAFKNPHGKN